MSWLQHLHKVMAMKSMMNADMCEKEPSSSLAFSSSSSRDL